MSDRNRGCRPTRATRPWLLACVLMLAACSELLVPQARRDLAVADFEAAWTHIDSIYPLFDFKRIDWDEVHTLFRARAERVRGDEIYALLAELLAVLRDGHAKVITEGGVAVAPHVSHRVERDRDAYDPSTTRRYVASPLRLTASGAIEYEWASPGIGYIRVSSFGNALRGRTEEIDAALSLLGGASGLILDVRNNGGGGSDVFNPILSRFIDASIASGSAMSRAGVRQLDSIAPHGGRRFTGPIVLLINGTSFSATEVFAEWMRQLPHVTLVGDTTAGAGMSSNADPRRRLPSGKSVSINYEAILRLDGEPIEWNGVAPDIRVSQSARDVAERRDRQLEFALDLLEDFRTAR